MLGGGTLLLNWIFGEEEYDLGENLNNKFRPAATRDDQKKKKKKKKAPDLSLVRARSCAEEEAWSAIQRGDLGNFYEGVDDQGERFVVDAEANISA